LIIFPEGTTTSGKHILKLKKGAFASLLPVKPVMIDTQISPDMHLSIGGAPLFAHIIRTLCYLYHNVGVTELPVIVPNDYLFDTWKGINGANEKWEIYAEAVRNIYVEAGGLIPSDKTYRDSVDYDRLVLGSKDRRKSKDEKNQNLNSNDQSDIKGRVITLYKF
jgi:hypothetical protein